ncbi:agrin isoform X2 [Eurytemora carolleeae]|uniref:agrin isoform X1 n=1 Tax=Eurytemora carolleeae TaxID=1294199 RepID=UPI000C78EAEA|nr:agrin isoform X1 [Eurytemora carolleeae]XP_023343382.1 agrin isoform X2 [Eurytemora carolleeae]|eukprot:XP_023343381.1 agrin-like isoform X1 [Eurytemora affinis]
MRKENCGDEISVADWTVCSSVNGSACEHKCDKEIDLVCGTDGRTYINQCFLQVEKCLREVEVAHYGACFNSTSRTTICPESCTGAARDGPVCGSNGNVYINSCELNRQTCGQQVVVAHRRHCKVTEHCDETCYKVSKVSCGSDGKLYNNGCQMKRKNCGKHIYEVPIGYCLNRLYRTSCPLDCTDISVALTCGSDGQIYSSECELRRADCGFPLLTFKKITKVLLENCKRRMETCSRMVQCPDEESAVCGNNGITYRNKCELQEATCKSGVQLSHTGSCQDLSKPNLPCPRACPETNQTQVVCASNGNVYPSLCHLRRETCGQRVNPTSLDMCQLTRYCEEDCTDKSEEYICGSDNSLYSNVCQMRKENCGKHIYRVPVSKCLSVFQWKGCARVCPPTLDPVCGSDGKTYLNPCFMQQETCRARSLGTGVSIEYYGRCGDPRQQPKFLPYFQPQIEYNVL